MNDDLKKYVKYKISISKIKEIEKVEKRNSIIKNFGLVACAFFILTTGVVFAKDIEYFIKDKFRLGKGIQTAVDNGYIENVDMDFIESNTSVKINNENIIDNIEIGCKVNSFFIDDYNLSIEFLIKLDNKINELTDLDKLKDVQLLDFIINDEEKRNIYSDIDKSIYRDENEKYMNSGIIHFATTYDKANNLIKVIYNMYLENEKYPNSKELNISFKKIKLNIENTSDILTLIGNWNIKADIPNKMISREIESYKVKSCENNKFNVYKAVATDTRFELGIIISDIIEPIYPNELEKVENEIYNSKGKVIEKTKEADFSTAIISSEDINEYYKDSPYKATYEEYYTQKYPIGNVRENFIYWIPKTKGNYILNSNGDVFELHTFAGGKGGNGFIEDNKYDYYETFNMTKYDATDILTVIVELYGSPVKIELERDK